MFWLYILILVMWYGVFRYKRRRIYAMVSHIKGPPDDLPFFGVSLSLIGSSEGIMNKLVEYSSVTTNSGGVAKAWLGPFLFFMITDPASIEVVLKNYLEKHNIHRFLKYIFGNSLIFAPVSIWKPRRKVAVPAFSPKIISGFVDVFAVQSLKLTELLKPMAGTGRFQIWPHINAYNLDSVMETAMGVPLNAQENNNNPILIASNDALMYTCERMFHPWLQPDWLYKLFPQYKKLKTATDTIHRFTDEVIARKKQQLSELETRKTIEKHLDLQFDKNITFLDLLISQSGGMSGYTNLELREEVLTFMLAATDTSAVTMGFTLKLLGKYPEVQQKVFEEIRAVFGNSDRLLERDDLPKLQYLERVIKETLRLYPSAPIIIRTTTEDSPLSEDITLPKGAGIAISIYGVHRNPKFWGPDADCFDPDRFLPERIKGMHPSSFIPFSHGPRNCLGYQYAMSSIKTALATILRRYKVIDEPEETPVPKIRVKLDIMMKAVDGYELALELHIMKKMVEYSKVTTDLGGISKAWLGPYLYFMVTDPAALEVVLKNNLEKDNLLRFLRFFLGNALVFAPVSIWKPRRKIAVPAFSPKIISSFVHIFAKQSEKLANLLKPKVGIGKFKIWSHINAYNLDSVMETAIGIPLNTQDNNENPILTAANDALKYTCERIFHPWLQPDWLFKLFPQYRKLKKATKIIHDFTDEVIRKKKLQIKDQTQSKVQRLDLLQNTNITFLDLLISQSGGSEGYTNLELREEVLTFILAATDTSAVAMGFALKLLGKYPEVQQKVFDEIEAVFGDSDRLLEKDDLLKLQYLERVIKETLRLYPSVPLLLRTTTEDSRLNENIVLPKGTGIVASVYGVHRNPNVWGPDVDCFDPDRFLPERTKGMHPCSFIPFSHGPRNCLGYQYAMMSIKTALSTILRRYKVVDDPEKGPVPNIRVKFDIMMKAVDGYEVALELRQK
ncbi:uncharacterized protein LOC119831263 [Zerene cesonia]|uniref:uncharacterized protein LOC119831263 n=1 Tax=Zerene cesonia TaxID=33412 RepID=UPI0018E52ACA|nr:uncharacterized protein LOC119831263 [Zerene cesonia]